MVSAVMGYPAFWLAVLGVVGFLAVEVASVCISVHSGAH